MELCIDGCIHHQYSEFRFIIIDTVYFKSGQSQIFYSNRCSLIHLRLKTDN